MIPYVVMGLYSTLGVLAKSDYVLLERMVPFASILAIVSPTEAPSDFYTYQTPEVRKVYG